MSEIKVTDFEFIAGLKVQFYGRVNDPAHALGTKVVADGDTYEIVGRFVDSRHSANERIVARMVEGTRCTQKAIHLSPGYHAEPGETPGHMFDLYTTRDVGENDRIWVGQLTADAVKAWKKTVTLFTLA